MASSSIPTDDPPLIDSGDTSMPDRDHRTTHRDTMLLTLLMLNVTMHQMAGDLARLRMLSEPIVDQEKREEAELQASIQWKVKPDDRYPVKDPTQYTEYEKRFPPDKFGEEMQENARVFRVYQTRANEIDQDKLDGWNKTLDNLLLFAALFSAVVAAFVIESFSDMKPDFAELTYKTMVAINSGSSMPNSSAFVPETLAIATNSLWFWSLGIGLGVALLSILTKQWIEEYSSRMRRHSASLQYWAWRHFVLSRGLSKWRVGALIATLPTLLHLALLLFFAGLVPFLWPVSRGISASIAAGSFIFLMFYAAAFFAPLKYGDCPSATPLHQICKVARKILNKFARGSASSAGGWMGILSIARFPQFRVPAFLDQTLLEGNEADRNEELLHWMITELPGVEDTHVAWDAVGSLPVCECSAQIDQCDEFPYPRLRSNMIRGLAVQRFRSLAISRHDAETLGLSLRALSLVCRNTMTTDLDHTDSQLRESIASIPTHDITILHLVTVPHAVPELRLHTPSKTRLLSLAKYLDSTNSMPVAKLSASLLPHQDAPLEMLLHQLAVLLCGFTTLSGSNQARIRHALSHVVRAVESRIFVDMQQEARGARLPILPVSAADWDASLHVRIAVVLVFLLKNSPSFYCSEFEGLSDRILRITTLQLAAESTPKQNSLLCGMGYLATEQFLKRDWSADDLLTIFPLVHNAIVYLREHSNPSDSPAGSASTVATYLRRILYKFSLLSHGARAAASTHHDFGHLASWGMIAFFNASSCSEVARELATMSSLSAALERTFLAVLTRESTHSYVRSAWHYAERSSDISEYGCRLARALCSLHRGGINIQHLLAELVADNFSPSDDGVVKEQRLDLSFAQHVREVSPDTWRNLARRLQQLPQRKWNLVIPPHKWRLVQDGHDAVTPDEYKTTDELIALVDAAGQCQDCPQHFAFAGATTRSTTDIAPSARLYPGQVPQYARVLNTEQAPPPMNALGYAPCSDISGEPLFLVLVPHRGGIHPGKMIIQHGVSRVYTSYGSCEIEHHGDYAFVPFDPQHHQWVPSGGGLLPVGARPVDAGREADGKPLFFALASVNGIRIPGKAGPHLRGATVPFDGREVRQVQCEILCWRTDATDVPAPSHSRLHPGQVPEYARILNTGHPLPPSDELGDAVCFDPAGSPSFLVLVPYRGGIHPGRLVMLNQQNIGRVYVGYRSDEIEHHGDYALVPFDPERHQWVSSPGGHLPGDLRPVEAGYEADGRPLFFAIGLVDNIRVPGKAGRHFGGMKMPFGGREHLSNECEILCWREGTAVTAFTGGEASDVHDGAGRSSGRDSPESSRRATVLEFPTIISTAPTAVEELQSPRVRAETASHIRTGQAHLFVSPALRGDTQMRASMTSVHVDVLDEGNDRRELLDVESIRDVELEEGRSPPGVS